MGAVLASCLIIGGTKTKEAREKRKAKKLQDRQQEHTTTSSEDRRSTAAWQEGDKPTRRVGTADSLPLGQESRARSNREVASAREGEEVTKVERVKEGLEVQGKVQREVGLEAPVPGLGLGVALSSTQQRKMATDDEYMKFLEGANKDVNEGVETKGEGGKVELKAVGEGMKVPSVLEKAVKERFYTSDADEPFVGVCLDGKGGGLPDEVTFAKLVHHPKPKEAKVEIMDISEWDTKGEYKVLVDAVREASEGSDVRVYKIEIGGVRVEYWVLSAVGGKLVGVKALGVES